MRWSGSPPADARTADDSTSPLRMAMSRAVMPNDHSVSSISHFASISMRKMRANLSDSSVTYNGRRANRVRHTTGTISLTPGHCRRWDTVAGGTLSPVGHCRQWETVASGTLSPVGHCRQWDTVASGTLSPVGHCRQWDTVARGSQIYCPL